MGNRHLIHVRSSQIIDGSPKLPTSENIEYGEIAINYAKDNEVISLRNSEDEIVTLNLHKYLENVNINNKNGTLDNHVASVVISGSDANVGDYVSVEYQEELSGAVNVSGSQTIAEAFNSVETTISALTEEVLKDETVVKNAVVALGEAAGTIDENNIISYVVNDSANYINTATSLANADDILDSAIKNVADSVKIENVKINGITATLNNKIAEVTISGSDVNVGTYEEVEYPNSLSGAVNVSGSQTIAEAFNSVETTISALTEEVIKDELVTEKSVKALGEATGTIDENNIISYVVNDSANYINTATSLANADDILDAKIKELEDIITQLTNRIAALENQ